MTLVPARPALGTNHIDTMYAAALAGLGGGKPRASSPAAASLGVAEIAADLSLLVPVQVRTGSYLSTLTLTATPTP